MLYLIYWLFTQFFFHIGSWYLLLNFYLIKLVYVYKNNTCRLLACLLTWNGIYFIIMHIVLLFPFIYNYRHVLSLRSEKLSIWYIHCILLILSQRVFFTYFIGLNHFAIFKKQGFIHASFFHFCSLFFLNTCNQVKIQRKKNNTYSKITQLWNDKEDSLSEYLLWKSDWRPIVLKSQENPW